MQAADFVREARNAQPELPPPSLLQLVAYQEGRLPDTDERIDQNARFRTAVLEELYKTLSLGDRPLIRFLLEQEIEQDIAYSTDKIDEQEYFESIYLCGFLLFLLAQVEDVPLLWRAKRASFDRWHGFDIQFLVGAGVPHTLNYLQNIQEEWAQEARAYIEKCQEARNFDDMERYREQRHAYFREMDTSEPSNALENTNSEMDQSSHG